MIRSFVTFVIDLFSEQIENDLGAQASLPATQGVFSEFIFV